MVERRRVALEKCRGQTVTLALKHDLAELNIKKSLLKEEGIREMNPRVHLGVVLKALLKIRKGSWKSMTPWSAQALTHARRMAWMMLDYSTPKHPL